MMQALKGSLVALVTPMEESGEVDYESLEKLINFIKKMELLNF